ncbi:CAP domain [Labeo rohita]|uniref:CAP domain n=1 Tax=Labeo rohita TaxID=84645 RepID=A0A498NXR5_LABRO|nr:CAP domain [Labeo rohita]
MKDQGSRDLPRVGYCSPHQVFNREQEETLSQYISQAADIYYGLTPREICSNCKKEQPLKQRLKKKLQRFDEKKEEWVVGRKKNHNSASIKDEAIFMLEKLHAIGYKPVLLLGKETKKKESKCEILIPRCTLSSYAKEYLQKIGSFYEYLCEGWNQNSCGNDEITLNLTPCDPMEISATVEQMSPVVELISPVVEQMSPVVEQVNPVVEQMSPVVEQMSPVVEQVEQMSPVVEQVSPVVEQMNPVVEQMSTKEGQEGPRHMPSRKKPQKRPSRNIG